jgi:hypothetical protein
MAVLPQHDWSYYEARLGESDAAWLRSLSIGDRFSLYEDLFNILWTARRKMPGDWARLDQYHWEEKVALRRRTVEAFSKLDQARRERAAANYAG